MSSGSATTHIWERSRLSLRQMRHGSESVMFWQVEHRMMLSLMARIASARARASSSGIRMR